MRAKLENGTLTLAPRKLHTGGRVVYNPTPDMLLAAGYLPVVYTDAPEVDEAHYAVPAYIERDGKIVQTWAVREIEANGEEEIERL